MNSADIYNEIKELNLSYLMLAQQLIRADRETAQYRLGIGTDIAEVIDRLTPGQQGAVLRARQGAPQHRALRQRARRPPHHRRDAV